MASEICSVLSQTVTLVKTAIEKYHVIVANTKVAVELESISRSAGLWSHVCAKRAAGIDSSATGSLVALENELKRQLHLLEQQTAAMKKEQEARAATKWVVAGWNANARAEALQRIRLDIESAIYRHYLPALMANSLDSTEMQVVAMAQQAVMEKDIKQMSKKVDELHSRSVFSQLFVWMFPWGKPAEEESELATANSAPAVMTAAVAAPAAATNSAPAVMAAAVAAPAVAASAAQMAPARAHNSRENSVGTGSNVLHQPDVLSNAICEISKAISGMQDTKQLPKKQRKALQAIVDFEVLHSRAPKQTIAPIYIPEPKQSQYPLGYAESTPEATSTQEHTAPARLERWKLGHKIGNNGNPNRALMKRTKKRTWIYKFIHSPFKTMGELARLPRRILDSY